MNTLIKNSLNELARTMNVIPEEERKDYWGIYDYVVENMNIRYFFVMILLCFSIKAMSQERDTIFYPKDIIWHPKEFRLIYPQMRLTFKLPYEEDQSGVRNLLFQHKETGKILLLDEEDRTHYRIYTKFYSDEQAAGKFSFDKYDAILLYNNGKYIKYNDITFDMNSFIAIDMTQCIVQPSCNESQQWLTMRAFIAPLGVEQELKRRAMITARFGKTTDYDMNTFSTYSSFPIKIRGYTFRECGWSQSICPNSGDYQEKTFQPGCRHDGYFELGLDGSNQSLFFVFALTHYPLEIPAPQVDCGLFIVLTETPLAKETLWFGNINADQ